MTSSSHWVHFLFLQSLALCTLGGLAWAAVRAGRRDARVTDRWLAVLLCIGVILPAAQWLALQFAPEVGTQNSPEPSGGLTADVTATSGGPATADSILRPPDRNSRLELPPQQGLGRDLTPTPPPPGQEPPLLTFGSTSAFWTWRDMAHEQSVENSAPLPFVRRSEPEPAFPTSGWVTPKNRASERKLVAQRVLASLRDWTRPLEPAAARWRCRVDALARRLETPRNTRRVHLLYSGVVVLLIVRQMRRAYATHRLVARSLPLADLTAQYLWRRLALSKARFRRVELRVSDEIRSPACTGLFRPVVVLPRRVLYSAQRRHLHWALRHEIAHLDRMDAWSALLQSCFTIVFWFHPVAWWLSAMIHRAREQACDCAVAESTGRRKSYALALVSFASELPTRPRFFQPAGAGTALLHWSFSRSELQRRIEMLANLRKRQPRRGVLGVIGGCVLLVLCGAQVGAAAWWSAPAQDIAAAAPSARQPVTTILNVPSDPQPVDPAAAVQDDKTADRSAKLLKEVEDLQQAMTRLDARMQDLRRELGTLDDAGARRQTEVKLEQFSAARQRLAEDSTVRIESLLSKLAKAQDPAAADVVTALMAKAGSHESVDPATLLTQANVDDSNARTAEALLRTVRNALKNGAGRPEDLLRKADQLEREAAQREHELEYECACRELEAAMEQARCEYQRAAEQFQRQLELRRSEVAKKRQAIERQLERDRERMQKAIDQQHKTAGHEVQRIESRYKEQEARAQELAQRLKSESDSERGEELRASLEQARQELAQLSEEMNCRSQQLEEHVAALQEQLAGAEDEHSNVLAQTEDELALAQQEADSTLAEQQRCLEDQLRELEGQAADLERQRQREAERNERQAEIDRLRAEAERLQWEAEQNASKACEDKMDLASSIEGDGSANTHELSEAVRRLSDEVAELRNLLLERDHEIEEMRARERQLIEELIKLLRESRPKISKTDSEGEPVLEDLSLANFLFRKPEPER